jgi:hypothetical protein
VDLIKVARHRYRWWNLLNTVMSISAAQEDRNSWNNGPTTSFSRKALLHKLNLMLRIIYLISRSLRIQEVRDSNLGTDFHYPDWDCCGFHQPLQENSGIPPQFKVRPRLSKTCIILSLDGIGL